MKFHAAIAKGNRAGQVVKVSRVISLERELGRVIRIIASQICEKIAPAYRIRPHLDEDENISRTDSRDSGNLSELCVDSVTLHAGDAAARASKTAKIQIHGHCPDALFGCAVHGHVRGIRGASIKLRILSAVGPKRALRDVVSDIPIPPVTGV